VELKLKLLYYKSISKSIRPFLLVSYNLMNFFCCFVCFVCLQVLQTLRILFALI
jgi:hypothetical protein